MNPDILKQLFEYNKYCIEVNTEGLTQADSLIQPQPAGNCLNWTLGHIVASRQGILALLQQPQNWDKRDSARYTRGSQPIVHADGAFTLERLLTDFQCSQDGVLRGLSKLTQHDFDKQLDQKTLGEKVSFLYFHETYHVGQVGLLRRMAGKPGVIR